MPKIDNYAPGRPCWVELTVPDPSAAKKFYGELLGWVFEDGQATEEELYTTIARESDPENSVGGMMRLTEQMAEMGAPPVWSTYISVADVNQSVADITAAGGTVIMEPMEVVPVSGEKVGHMAIAADPTGGIFGIWQAGEHKGADVMGELGTIGWNEIGTTSRIDDLFPFYSSVFGWERTTHEMQGMPPAPDGSPATYNEFKVGGNPVAGGIEIPPEAGPPGSDMGTFWAVYFQVENCDESTQKALALGANQTMPPTDIPDGRFSALIDPQGARFCLIHMNDAG